MTKWSYKAVFIASNPNLSGDPLSSEAMARWQDEMNHHGVGGWEAFWITEKPNGLWIFFKTSEPN